MVRRTFTHLLWTDDGAALLAIRHVSVDRGEVVVLDAGRDFAVRDRWGNRPAVENSS